MKKVLILIFVMMLGFVLVLFYSNNSKIAINKISKISQNETANNKEVLDIPTNTMQEGDGKEQSIPDGWKKYTIHQLGLEFMYPGDYEISITKENTVLANDVGKMIQVTIASKDNMIRNWITGFSKDFAHGTSEGCCFVFSDDPVNTELDLYSVANKINSLRPHHLEKINVGGRVAYHYHSIKEYADFWTIEEVLIPFGGTYTNIIVAGPMSIYQLATGGDVPRDIAFKNISNKLEKKDFDKSPKALEHRSIFEKIYKSIQFRNNSLKQFEGTLSKNYELSGEQQYIFNESGSKSSAIILDSELLDNYTINELTKGVEIKMSAYVYDDDPILYINEID